MSDIDKSLQDVLIWAENKEADSSQPPWARDTYEKLIDALRAVIRGRDCTITLEDSLLLEKHLEIVPQQLAYKDQTNIVRLHPRYVKVQMPI
jgi:hypothetical protein